MSQNGFVFWNSYILQKYYCYIINYIMEITYYLYYKLYYLYYKLYCADNFGSVTVSDRHKLIGRRSWVVQREVESKQALRTRCMASYSNNPRKAGGLG